MNKIDCDRRIEFLGCPLDCITCNELLEDLAQGIVREMPPRVIQFVNANKVAMVHKDSSMGEILKRADFVLADGQPMLPMAALLGRRVPERIDGIGLMQKLLRLSHRKHFSVYLLGARQEILDECVRRIREEFPGLVLVGSRNGYFTQAELPAIAAEIRGKAPDFLFLGLGSPMKERLADEWKEQFGARVIQGVGGSFDVIAGMVKRAPLWMQRCGIEWLYRIIQEPRRMFWRYAKTNGACLWVFFGAFCRRWFLPRQSEHAWQGHGNTEELVISTGPEDPDRWHPQQSVESFGILPHVRRETGRGGPPGRTPVTRRLANARKVGHSRIRRIISRRYRKAGKTVLLRRATLGR